MEDTNRIHTALKSGKAAFGIWQMLPGHNLSRILSRTGVDWICVDCEHGDIADAAMHQSVQAIGPTGVSPIVRIPGMEGWMFKRALDAGAHGIVCPLIKTADDARAVVKACKFPPRGERGYGSPFAMASFPKGNGANPTALDYLTQANDNLVTIVQIETKEALENVDAIAAVDGIDVLFVGPFDLGNNIGRPAIPVMHEELKAAIEKVRQAAKNAGKYSGIFCLNGKEAKSYADGGFNMISVVGDYLAVQVYAAEQIAVAKGSGS